MLIMSKNKILYIVKNLLLFLFLFACLKLLPNIFESGIVGYIFFIIVIIYILVSFVSYLAKSKQLIYNVIQNVLEILLYLYIYLISYKYTELLTSPIYSFSDNYFIINYTLAIIAMIGIMLNSYFILNEDIKNNS